jgi:uncharacterized membrane protein YphA (DoxX/SURF4 family)
MNRKLVVEIISLLLITLFVYAATSKLLDYEKFTVQIGQSPVLTGFRDYLPWLVISIELLVSVALLVPRFRLAGLFAAFSLMVMFTCYIIAILNFSTYIPCSCGGVLEKLGWTEHLIFNGVFVVLSFIGVVIQFRLMNNQDPGTFSQPSNA